eukprot:2822978-Pleurochrysis_carterae.AAC.1
MAKVSAGPRSKTMCFQVKSVLVTLRLRHSRHHAALGGSALGTLRKRARRIINDASLISSTTRRSCHLLQTARPEAASRFFADDTRSTSALCFCCSAATSSAFAMMASRRFSKSTSRSSEETRPRCCLRSVLSARSASRSCLACANRGRERERGFLSAWGALRENRVRKRGKENRERKLRGESGLKRPGEKAGCAFQGSRCRWARGWAWLVWRRRGRKVKCGRALGGFAGECRCQE